MEDQKIVKEIDLGNGYLLIVLEDGTARIVKQVSELTEDLVEAISEAFGGKKEEKPAKGKVKEEEDEDDKPAKSKSKKAPEPEEEEEDEPEGYTWEDLKEMDEEELKELISENDLDTDPEDFEDDEVGLRKAIAKEIGVEVPKKKK